MPHSISIPLPLTASSFPSTYKDEDGEEREFPPQWKKMVGRAVQQRMLYGEAGLLDIEIRMAGVYIDLFRKGVDISGEEQILILDSRWKIAGNNQLYNRPW